MTTNNKILEALEQEDWEGIHIYSEGSKLVGGFVSMIGINHEDKLNG